MKFAIFGNTYQAKKSSHAENLFRLLAQRKAQLCVCREFYNFLTSDLHLNIPPPNCSTVTISAPIWLSASEVTAHF
mgnify:CR=1 FL=1